MLEEETHQKVKFKDKEKLEKLGFATFPSPLPQPPPLLAPPLPHCTCHPPLEEPLPSQCM